MCGLAVIGCLGARRFIMRVARVIRMVVRLCAGTLHAFMVSCRHAQSGDHARHALDRDDDRDYHSEEPKKLQSHSGILTQRFRRSSAAGRIPPEFMCRFVTTAVIRAVNEKPHALSLPCANRRAPHPATTTRVRRASQRSASSRPAPRGPWQARCPRQCRTGPRRKSRQR